MPAATGGARAELTDLTADPDEAPAATGTTDLAGLVDEVYERVESRLRADLLHERERLGSLPDP